MEVKIVKRSQYKEIINALNRLTFDCELPEHDYDFAMIGKEDDKIIGYITFMTSGHTACYLCLGGILPEYRSYNTLKFYFQALDKLKKIGFKHFATQIKNDNITMLRLAHKAGFKIVGIYYMKNNIYLNLTKDEV